MGYSFARLLKRTRSPSTHAPGRPGATETTRKKLSLPTRRDVIEKTFIPIEFLADNCPEPIACAVCSVLVKIKEEFDRVETHKVGAFGSSFLEDQWRI